ncbi:MAG: hypothetical protein OEV74_02870 [Cyclobacteriaceae bacterium]|nr:hypothetical protein [Cyclobacteriaceae bacterium]MDH4295197.1 hypothetical protein [Cyclobacteriaceae bacterium]MDH5248913.1 hypothetical protein [Cyclobacteriaceae bacterium]
MKGLLVILFALMVIAPAFGQDEDLPTVQDTKVRDKIQAARIAYITDQLALTPAEAEKFWPIYREFAEKRRDIRQQLRDVGNTPSQNKTKEQIDRDLVDRQFNVKQQELNLEKDYSGRLLKVISAQKLRTLPEAERRFRQMILEQIQRRQLQQERQRNLQDQSQQRLQQRNN